MTESTELRDRVASIVRSMVSYDDEEPGINKLMALFAEHHCASCDMHSCGNLERQPLSLETLLWPIERLNPQTGKPWTPQERIAMGLGDS